MTPKKNGRPSLRQQGESGETRRNNLDTIIIARRIAVCISLLSLARGLSTPAARWAVVEAHAATVGASGRRPRT